MKLNEALRKLRAAGYICEDTDDWDEADMPAGFTKKNREETVKRHNGRNWYSSAGVDAMANKHDDVEEKITNAADFNIQTLITGIEKELKKDYKNVKVESPYYEEDNKYHFVRYYFTYKVPNSKIYKGRTTYMLNVMYYVEDEVIKLEIYSDASYGNESYDFSVSTIDNAIEQIMKFVYYFA